MERAELKANNLAQKIKTIERQKDCAITPQGILDWKKNHPPRHRCKVLACAKALGLTETQTNDFLEAAGFEKEYELLPEVIFTDFVSSLFTQLRQLRPPVMLLLTQAHWGEPPYREAILVQAKRHYARENVLHLQSPPGFHEDFNHYFIEFGKQCGFAAVDNVSTFTVAFQERLEKVKQQGKILFVLFSRFEQIPPAVHKPLASVIRGFSEMYPTDCHIILCGGKELSELKFRQGNLSLLNSATVKRWPELGLREVYGWWEHHFKEPVQMNKNLANALLDVSGGHPKLLMECLNLYQAESDLTIRDYQTCLIDSKPDYIWQAFTQLIEKPTARQQIREWLQRDEVGPAQPYILNEVLRELYWRNLVKDTDGKLIWWRCEVIRKIGEEVVNGVG